MLVCLSVSNFLTGVIGCWTVIQSYNGLFQKKSKQVGWGYNFLKPPHGIFRFVTLPLKILEKTSFYPWKFCRIVWYLLEIPTSKIKTRGNSTPYEFFASIPENSTSFLIDPLEFPHTFSSVPLEIDVKP